MQLRSDEYKKTDPFTAAQRQMENLFYGIALQAWKTEDWINLCEAEECDVIPN